jgi:hypothetical protein
MLSTCFLLYLVLLDKGPEGSKHLAKDNGVELGYNVMKLTD